MSKQEMSLFRQIVMGIAVLVMLFAFKPMTAEAASIDRNFWKSMGSDYFYNQLNDKQKEYADLLENACLDYLCSDSDNSDIVRVNWDYRDLSLQEKQFVQHIFAVSKPQYYFIYGYDYAGIYVMPEFRDPAMRAAATNAINSKMADWVSQINMETLPERKEFKALKLVCENTAYGTLGANNSDPLMNLDSEGQTIFSVLYKNAAVCNGYTMTMVALLNASGIDSFKVYGDNHAVAYVNLHGNWYMCDPTSIGSNYGIYGSDYNSWDSIIEGYAMSEFVSLPIYNSEWEPYFTEDGVTYFCANRGSDAKFYNPDASNVSTIGVDCAGGPNTETKYAMAVAGFSGKTLPTSVVDHVTGVTYNVVPNISINENSIGVEVNQRSTQRLSASVGGNRVNPQTITWVSEDTSIATVDGNGYVTGKRAGGTNIYACYGDFKIPCHVEVYTYFPIKATANGNDSLQIDITGKNEFDLLGSFNVNIEYWDVRGNKCTYDGISGILNFSADPYDMEVIGWPDDQYRTDYRARITGSNPWLASNVNYYYDCPITRFLNSYKVGGTYLLSWGLYSDDDTPVIPVTGIEVVDVNDSDEITIYKGAIKYLLAKKIPLENTDGHLIRWESENDNIVYPQECIGTTQQEYGSISLNPGTTYQRYVKLTGRRLGTTYINVYLTGYKDNPNFCKRIKVTVIDPKVENSTTNDVDNSNPDNGDKNNDIDNSYPDRGDKYIEDGIQFIDGDFYLVINGEIAYYYNDLFFDSVYGWWKIANGRVDFGYSDLYFSPTFGWWKIIGGTVDFGYSDLYFSPTFGWWKIIGGAVDFGYSDLYFSPTFGWWKIIGGTVDFGYSDLYFSPTFGWWKINGGAVDFGYSDLFFSPAVGWWKIIGGTIDFGYSDLYFSPTFGWWKIIGGAVDFGYSGLYESPSVGIWNISNGMLVF